jgi:hypothetical protein
MLPAADVFSTAQNRTDRNDGASGMVALTGGVATSGEPVGPSPRNLTPGCDSNNCYHHTVAKTVTLRLSDSAYAAVRRYAEADKLSMNAFIESLLDFEDMRRRCGAHDRWMQEHPEAVAFSEAWADQNFDGLTKR